MKELVKLEKESSSDAMTVAEQFAFFAEEVESFKKRASEIEVSSLHDRGEMEDARLLHKEVVARRVELKAIHDELKKIPLEKGRLIDGVYNIAKALLAPIEEDLKTKKDFMKSKEAIETEQLRVERLKQLEPYLIDGDPEVDVVSFEEDEWDLIVDSRKIRYERHVKEAETLRLEIESKEKYQAELENVIKVLKFRDGIRGESLTELYTIATTWIEELTTVRAKIETEL